MEDLVNEIRALKKDPQLSIVEHVIAWNALVTLANEAADEIARLRAEVERLTSERIQVVEAVRRWGGQWRIAMSDRLEEILSLRNLT